MFLTGKLDKGSTVWLLLMSSMLFILLLPISSYVAVLPFIQDEWFLELTGYDIESTFAPSLFELTALGLLDWNGRRLCTTDSGRLVLEELVRKLALLVDK